MTDSFLRILLLVTNQRLKTTVCEIFEFCLRNVPWQTVRQGCRDWAALLVSLIDISFTPRRDKLYSEAHSKLKATFRQSAFPANSYVE